LTINRIGGIGKLNNDDVRFTVSRFFMFYTEFLVEISTLHTVQVY